MRNIELHLKTTMRQKTALLFLAFCIQSLVSFSGTNQEPNPKSEVNKKIQVAFLIDASTSMAPYHNQVKFMVSNMIKKLNDLKYNDKKAVVQIALYEYGNSDVSSEVSFVRQLSYLSTDQNFVNQKLFEIFPKGDTELCSNAIGKALNELDWSIDTNDLRMMFIIGNEAFNQGNTNYKVMCEIAADHMISVNTIYCGNNKKGIDDFWQDAASNGKGNYFSLDTTKQSLKFTTKLDVPYYSYQDSLSKTYYDKKMMDDVMFVQEPTVRKPKPRPTPSKSDKNKTPVSNENIPTPINLDELIDEDREGISITSIPEEKLPKEFQGLTDAEKKALIQKKVLQENGTARN